MEMVELHEHVLNSEKIRPQISESTIENVFQIAGETPFIDRLHIVHPDIDPAIYTLAGIRKTFTPQFDQGVYTAGFEAYLSARDIELELPKDPYYLANDMRRYILRLTGSANSKSKEELKDLNDRIYAAYEENPMVAPTFDKNLYPLIEQQLISHTHTYIDQFPTLQPFITEYLAYRIKLARNDKALREQIHMWSLGIIDGDRIFKTLQDEEFANRFGMSGKLLKKALRN